MKRALISFRKLANIIRTLTKPNLLFSRWVTAKEALLLWELQDFFKRDLSHLLVAKYLLFLISGSKQITGLKNLKQSLQKNLKTQLNKVLFPQSLLKTGPSFLGITRMSYSSRDLTIHAHSVL